MNRRLLAVFVAVAFLLAAGSAAAQFGPLKKKKEEKPAETKEEKKETQASSTSSSAETMRAVTWGDNHISFEVPGDWQQMLLERDIASFMQMPATDSAGLNATISRMPKDFPAASSLKAYREDAAKKKDKKGIVSYEDYTAGKVKGVMWIEAEKANPDDVRRMTWMGFQKGDGWNQVIVHLSSKSGAFARHEATFRKVLASLKVETQ